MPVHRSLQVSYVNVDELLRYSILMVIVNNIAATTNKLLLY